MARDLSASPWRSAAIAPLLTPMALTLLAAMDGGPIAGAGGPDTLLRSLLMVWLIAYAYMWVLAIPIMLLSRRWITWSWIRVMVLGALLGALPWTLVVISELRARTDSLSFAQLVREFFGSLFFMDGSIVVKFGALGAFIAGAFCLLQLYVTRAPSNNALERTREG